MMGVAMVIANGDAETSQVSLVLAVGGAAGAGLGALLGAMMPNWRTIYARPPGFSTRSAGPSVTLSLGHDRAGLALTF